MLQTLSRFLVSKSCCSFWRCWLSSSAASSFCAGERKRSRLQASILRPFRRHQLHRAAATRRFSCPVAFFTELYRGIFPAVLLPPSLDGFEIRQSEGKTTLAWKGMSCDLSSQQLLSQSGAGLFMQILGQLSDGLDEQQIQIEPEEGSFRLTFPIQECGSCSVVLEEQTLALLSIECPEQDASFILSDFQYTSQTPQAEEPAKEE